MKPFGRKGKILRLGGSTWEVVESPSPTSSNVVSFRPMSAKCSASFGSAME